MPQLFKYPSLITVSLLLFTETAIAFGTAPWAIAATIVSVGDGDTLRVREGQQHLTVRLACIDAPEKAQRPYGASAAARLRQLLPAGKSVSLRIIGKDKYGRTIAEVFTQKRSINLQMVQEGQAAIYRQYLSGCSGDELLAAEAAAKKKKLGFWNQTNPTMPWDFRAGRATSSAPSTYSDSRKCDTAYPDVCIPSPPPDINCRGAGYRRFRVLPPDPHGFDGDGDGIGCE